MGILVLSETYIMPAEDETLQFFFFSYLLMFYNKSPSISGASENGATLFRHGSPEMVCGPEMRAVTELSFFG